MKQDLFGDRLGARSLRTGPLPPKMASIALCLVFASRSNRFAMTQSRRTRTALRIPATVIFPLEISTFGR